MIYTIRQTIGAERGALEFPTALQAWHYLRERGAHGLSLAAVEAIPVGSFREFAGDFGRNFRCRACPNFA